MIGTNEMKLVSFIVRAELVGAVVNSNHNAQYNPEAIRS
jgi:hypothetical protein